MKKKSIIAISLVLLTVLTGCGERFDHEEEIVLVDQPKDEKYKN